MLKEEEWELRRRLIALDNISVSLSVPFWLNHKFLVLISNGFRFCSSSKMKFVTSNWMDWGAAALVVMIKWGNLAVIYHRNVVWHKLLVIARNEMFWMSKNRTRLKNCQHLNKRSRTFPRLSIKCNCLSAPYSKVIVKQLKHHRYVLCISLSIQWPKNCHPLWLEYPFQITCEITQIIHTSFALERPRRKKKIIAVSIPTLCYFNSIICLSVFLFSPLIK